MPTHEEAHLRILNIVSAEPEISQRQLAARLGVSLGKINFLIKALLQEGLIKVGNFQRARNKHRYVYALTPKGIGERVRLIRTYLARKETEYEALQNEILALRREMWLVDRSGQEYR